MKRIYFTLAIIGGVIPYMFFFQFIQAEGFNIVYFVESIFVNGAAGGFSVDLLYSSFVFWLFMFMQQRKTNAPKPYLFIVLNLTVGLSCALPAYLYAVEKVIHNKI
jgi:hypothetical protein